MLNTHDFKKYNLAPERYYKNIFYKRMFFNVVTIPATGEQEP